MSDALTQDRDSDTSAPPSDRTTDDVLAIIRGMNRAPARDLTQALVPSPLPPSLQPNYRPAQPVALQPQQTASIVPTPLQPQPQPPPPQQSRAPWAVPPLQSPPAPSPIQPPAQAQPPPQPPVQAQPPQLEPGTNIPKVERGERPPVNNMPALWNGSQVGPSGQTKQQFLVGRMMHESQGDPNVLNYVARDNPHLYDAGFTAGGLLQDLNTTWQRGLKYVAANPERYPIGGEDLSKYPTARHAPWQVQWQVNSAIYDHEGERPWSGQGGGARFDQKRRSDDNSGPVGTYQTYAQSEQRESEDWGHPPPMSGVQLASAGMGQPRPGEQPRQSDFGRIMTGILPLLVGIGSLALRLPLSAAINAYGATERAITQGQNVDYERNRQKQLDSMKQAGEQQTQESREAGDAFITYGHNNPVGLQQELARIALKYNDPMMFQLAQRGDLNKIYQLQQHRDMYNQDLLKTHKAMQEQKEQQDIDAAVRAKDNEWHDKFVKDNNREPTQDESAVAHVEHQAEINKLFDKSSSSGAVTDYNVVGQDGKVIRQVQQDKDGHLRDLQGNPAPPPGPGEQLVKVGTKAEGEGGGSEEATPYNVVKKDTREPTGRKVRMGKNGGLFDLNGQPTTLGPDEDVDPVVRPRSASGKDETLGDYTWTNPDGSKGEGYAKVKGNRLVDAVTEEPIPTKPGTRVNKISPQSANQAGNAAGGVTGPIQDWEGMNEGKAPPGVSEADWVQAQDWARLGRAPPGLSSRSGAYQGAHDALPYALHAMGKTGADMPRDAIDYDTQRTASTSTERYFTSGMGARQLTALDTVAAHIGLFREYAAAVKSGNITAINEVAGRLATATGSPELIDMGIASTITGDEVIRLLTQTGGSRGDREEIKKELSIYSAPEQFEGIANTLTNFVRERYDPLRQQYTNRIGATPTDKARYEEAFKNKITPAARAIIENKQPIAGATDVPVMTEQQYNGAPSGTRYRMPNDPPGTFRTKP